MAMAPGTTAIPTARALRNKVEFASKAIIKGCERDQLRNFALAGYSPLDGYLPFHGAARAADHFGGPEWVALGGKRGPGKSHAAMAQAALDDCQRVNGLKVLFLRKVMKTASESLEDLVRRLCYHTAHVQTANEIRFPNDSRILLGGYKDARDIDKYLGIEYDEILIEECTQLLEAKKDAIRGSLRSSKANWRPRIYLTTNADGPGLMWFKKMFVLPYRAGKETTTRFFDVTGITNPFIGPEYNLWLDTLTGPLRKAWRDGDWDAFAGMSFPDWNHERHILTYADQFEIPHHWPKWRSLDWGLAAPFSNHWWAKNPDTTQLHVYREHYEAGLTTKQQAAIILAETPPEEAEVIKLTYADPSLWNKKEQDGKITSTEQEMRLYGVPLTKGDNNRLQGMRKAHNVLADLPTGEPGLLVWEQCVHLIEQMESLAADPHNPEDVDTSQEDHAFDDFKYGLTNERRIAAQPAPQKVQRLPSDNKYF